jgi:hypothetical protein
VIEKKIEAGYEGTFVAHDEGEEKEYDRVISKRLAPVYSPTGIVKIPVIKKIDAIMYRKLEEKAREEVKKKWRDNLTSEQLQELEKEFRQKGTLA